ncbi:hypothetical protein CYMTET_15913 [Cymbomonas tetramitiformis]|uniref:Uncharacterized protein n=1 Tax=Cymbomonas tetramitiformis TaxID=36881 RepID=A0AAE0F7S1_9CHLO|nr:hypothetical protein CYMTET_36781 [Cymbomonas tetramitiformis]KAK3275989.1 hypothetical protein CYMTET_15913 [Cymbomonas tetramitiformis]
MSVCTEITLSLEPVFPRRGHRRPDTHRFWVRIRATVFDETTEPTPQLAVIRTLADKHHRLHSNYSDRDLVEDCYTGFRSSASASPYVTPLYLVVLHELGTTHGCTFASLTLRLGGATRTGGGGDGKATAGSAYSLDRRKFVLPEGTWKKQENGGWYLIWDGTGVSCVTCFRLWADTTGHMDTDGVCLYVCN